MKGINGWAFISIGLNSQGVSRHAVAIDMIRKFVGEKKFGDDIYAFLFSNRDNHQLQILWKNKGRMSFMTWFGNAHIKPVDAVGDLILGE